MVDPGPVRTTSGDGDLAAVRHVDLEVDGVTVGHRDGGSEPDLVQGRPGRIVTERADRGEDDLDEPRPGQDRHAVDAVLAQLPVLLGRDGVHRDVAIRQRNDPSGGRDPPVALPGFVTLDPAASPVEDVGRQRHPPGRRRAGGAPVDVSAPDVALRQPPTRIPVVPAGHFGSLGGEEAGLGLADVVGTALLGSIRDDAELSGDAVRGRRSLTGEVLLEQALQLGHVVEHEGGPGPVVHATGSGREADVGRI